MSNENQKYTTYKDIAFRLSLVHKQKNFSDLQIATWCAECEIDYLGDTEGFRKYQEVEMDVDSNYVSRLPCNVYRILDVYDRNYKPIQYRNNGVYLEYPSTYPYDKAYINYYGIAIDPETGYPYIKKGHEQACEAFCVNKLYYEDFLNGKLSPTAWNEIANRMEIELMAAKGSFRHRDNEDMRKLKVIMFNMLPRIGNETISHLRFLGE